MCQAPFYVLFKYSFFESSQQPYKVGIIIISILQVRKLRLREFRDMTKVSQLTGRRAGIQIDLATKWIWGVMGEGRAKDESGFNTA